MPSKITANINQEIQLILNLISNYYSSKNMNSSNSELILATTQSNK